MPSFQVCSKLESPTLPHFWNQEPPRAQQLSLPALLSPHLTHAIGTTGVVLDPGIVVLGPGIVVPLQASMPSFQVCSKLESPILPHFWNQEPPRAQQLSLPALFVAHLTHAIGTTGVVLDPGLV